MYGKVISGGASMRKGVSKGINDKLETLKAARSSRQITASAVADAFKVDTLSQQHTNNVNGGKFTKGTRPAKV
jgi:hypothetical protein